MQVVFVVQQVTPENLVVDLKTTFSITRQTPPASLDVHSVCFEPQAKSLLRLFVQSQNDPSSVAVLLHGPPGSGKKTLARSLGESLLVPVIPVDLAELMSLPGAGAPECKLEAFFSLAKSISSVLLISNIENIGSGSLSCALKDLIVESQTYESALFLICTTSRIELVSEDLLLNGVFDLKMSVQVSEYADRVRFLESFPLKGVELRGVHRLARARSDYQLGDLASALSRLAWERCLLNQDLDCLDLEHSSSLNLKLRQRSIEAKPLGDFLGIDPILQDIEAFLLSPLKDIRRYLEFGLEIPRGVLFYGPEGCGKTSLVLALAQHCVLQGLVTKYFILDGSQVVSKQVGSSESNLRHLFDECRQNAPSILIIDQIEYLAPNRKSSNSESDSFDRILSTMLTEMDGVSSKSTNSRPVIVMATCRNLREVDAAILRPGRLDLHFELSLPCEAYRKDYLMNHSSVYSNVEFHCLIPVTEGLSYSDLDNLIREACMNRLRADHSACPADVTNQDFEDALMALRKGFTITK